MKANKSRRSRILRSALGSAVIETLEQRQLLATLAPGDVYYYQNPTDQQVVKITVTGSGQTKVTIIGATSNPSDTLTTLQAPLLTEIPGLLVDAAGNQREFLGGIGGVDGVEPVDVINPGFNESRVNVIGGALGFSEAPSGDINIQGLSSSPTGVTWGFNLVQVTPPGGNSFQQLQLLNLAYRGNSDATFAVTQPNLTSPAAASSA